MPKEWLYSHLPNKPGVYFFKSKENEVLYVGKALNLKSRVGSYFTLISTLAPKTKKLLNQTEEVDYLLVNSEFEALLTEARLIKKYQPKYNVRFKDDKRFPSIAISIKEKFPRVYYTRKREETKENKDVLFFGPFPDPAIVKRVLRLIRKIFPYRSCKRLPSKPCLYYHLGFCLGLCFKPSAAQEYKKIIIKLVKLLKGKKESLIEQLKLEMKKVAKSKNFELAAKLKKQIGAIEYITQAWRRFELLLEFDPESYQKEKKELEKLLEIRKIERVEGYDISDIGGKWATGSMVIFINGQPEKTGYRHFKIKGGGTPDDPRMIKEVITRRLRHSDWQYPDLMIVDGGKGQVSAVGQALHLSGVVFPVIGLAKKEETIFVPLKKGSFKIIKLPEDSPGLHLLQRVRDEAHRFAQSYHQKLRLAQF